MLEDGLGIRILYQRHHADALVGAGLKSLLNLYKKRKIEKEEIESIRNRVLIIEPVHTSGHAIIEDLQAFAKALNPRVPIPIHTFEANKYPELFENVKILSDGEEYQI